jgi:hypothetical protein
MALANAPPIPSSTKDQFSTVNQAMKSVSDVAPIIITGFLFMNTVFNADIKALIWIGPLIFWLLILKFTQSKTEGNKIINPACSKIWGSYKSPSLSSFFILYTLGYMAAPMPIYNDWNIMAVISFVVLFCIDAAARMRSDCSSKAGIAIGGLTGLILGVFMYFVLTWVGLGKFLYYSTGSNNVYCSKPKEQNFKCHVYKNGNIISTI